MHRIPLLALVAVVVLSPVVGACSARTPVVVDDTAEGEGEGIAEGEGEGVGAEGEGEGVVVAEGEGEGESNVPGEGEGEGEGAVAAEGEGEGAPAPTCTSDRQCDLGFVCVAGDCVGGCHGNDCPGSLLCDTALGAHGTCVECLTSSTCNVAGGESCIAGQCAFACANDTACAARNQVCDEAHGRCVDCTGDRDCDAGSICVDDTCTIGCRTTSDCGNGEACGPDAVCIPGCGNDDACALGSHCGTGGYCEFGCGNNDARCPQGQQCDVDVCVRGCDGTAGSCPGGSTCVSGTCIEGCTSDGECGRFTATPKCLIAQGAPRGTCVGCIDGQDCAFGTTCDVAAHTCRVACSAFGGGAPRCFGGQVCEVTSGSCVDCLVDGDCGATERCDVAAHTCIANPPAPADVLCADCTGSDAQCGGTSLCVTRRLGLFATEQACGIDCSDGTACPSGFVCELVERGFPAVAVGAQCVPFNRATDVETCNAVRDAQDALACAADGDCGGRNLADGICLNAVCTLPCLVDDDCTPGTVCAPVAGRDVQACQ